MTIEQTNEEGIARAKRGRWARYETMKEIFRQIMIAARKVVDSATTWISRKHPPPRTEWTSKFPEMWSSLRGVVLLRHDSVDVLVERCTLGNPGADIV